MSADIVPYGAIGVWRFEDDVAEVAAKYRIPFKLLKNGDGRSGWRIAQARDALAWKLVKQRGFSSPQAAKHLKIDEKTVREAVTRHTHRIAEFQARFKPVHAEAAE